MLWNKICPEEKKLSILKLEFDLEHILYFQDKIFCIGSQIEEKELFFYQDFLFIFIFI